MAAAEAGRPAGRWADIGLRIAVAVPLALLVLAAIWAGGYWFAALVAAGVGLVCWEWLAMHKVPLPWRLWCVLALVLTMAFAATGSAVNALLFLLAIGILAVSFAFVMRAKYEGWLAGGLFYAGVPGVALLFLRQQLPGLDLLLWVMGLVWATDICAYVAGRAIGGPKIWPAISPGKTWAGLAGGMAGAAGFTAALALGRGWSAPLLLLVGLGALLAVVAQAGDFFESWLKRRAGVKDSGTLLPGHGGLMDRVDGLLPVALVVALAWALGGAARLGLAAGGALV